MVSVIQGVINFLASSDADASQLVKEQPLNLNRWINQKSASQGLANVHDYACCDCVKQVHASEIIQKRNGVYYAFCDNHCHEGRCRNDPSYLEWINRYQDANPVIPERVWTVVYEEVVYPQLQPYKRGDPIEGRICTMCCMDGQTTCAATIVRDDIPICKNCDESWDLQDTYLSEYHERKSYYDYINKVRRSLQTGQQQVKVVQRIDRIVEVL